MLEFTVYNAYTDILVIIIIGYSSAVYGERHGHTEQFMVAFGVAYRGGISIYVSNIVAQFTTIICLGI